MDNLSPEDRKKAMKGVRSKNTSAELKVRKNLHRLGYRFRVNFSKLPGHPDIAFTARHKLIMIHGCFWHGHNCGKQKLPQTNSDYWRTKILKNVLRDQEQVKILEEMGWESLVVWECELKDIQWLQKRLKDFLGPPRIK
jgi:DNA mismatch endonuclease (patch repair protein)